MKTKLLALLLVIAMAVGMLAACGGKDPDPCTSHVDNDGDGLCDNEGCDEPVKKTCTAHVDADNNGACDNCGAAVQKKCDNHVDANGDTLCDNCGEYYDVWDEITVSWDETQLIMSLGENSNAGQLPSTCRRYMAGEDTRYSDIIDDYVTERNTAAYAKTKVKVVYDYSFTESSEFGWGQCNQKILTKVNGGGADAPDIYVNFIYDLVAVSILNGFANLYSKSRASEGVEEVGANYFQFSGDFDTYEDSGNGYMIEYMKSLSLSKYKMYCLSSDYFTDMVRAFFVVPVNKALMNTIPVSAEAGQFNSDRTGDGKFTIDDFYQLVWDGEWNYQTLAQFAAVITKDSGEDTATTNLDDTVGWAVDCTSGLPASGIMYTTSVTIINRDWSEELDDGKGDFVYSYPNPDEEKGRQQIADLTALCDNLNELFNKPGVITVKTGDPDQAATGTANAFEAIRLRFSEDKVLFGSVVCLGALEDESTYQTMKGEDRGFGIVPVPLYRTQEEAKADPDNNGQPDEYLTSIHNNGRVCGISRTTVKFAQCSAFLDYVSTRHNGHKDSTDIINYYYDVKLQYDISDGSSGNTEMLQYIRAHVRSSFDKAYEDAIGMKFTSVDPEANENKWHYMLHSTRFKVNDMNARYKGLYSTKEGYLRSLWNDFGIAD